MQNFCLIALIVAFAGPSLDAKSEEWENVYICEHDEAVVKQHLFKPGKYQLTLKNNDINIYLGLGDFANPHGHGEPTTDVSDFVGFNSIVSRFNHRDTNSNPSKIAHIFPAYGGLKVLVEREAFFYCDYYLNYGDSSGLTHTISAPIGSSCPDLRPTYSFRNTRPGQDRKSSANWFFQNCASVKDQ